MNVRTNIVKTIRRIINRSTFKEVSDTLREFITSTWMLQWLFSQKVYDSKSVGALVRSMMPQNG